MRAAILTLLVLSLAACGSGGTVRAAPWTLVWSDEFDGPAGPPDAAKWLHDVGAGPNNDGWGNQQLEFDTDSTENAGLDGQGNLVITARQQAMGNKAYTSARLNTLGTFAQRYGRIEARIKLPTGKGLWPAFWMLGDSCTVPPGWPSCGEIDILELRGQDPTTVFGSLHGPEYFAANALSNHFQLTGASFDQDFHVFAVEWDPTRITFLVDEQAYQTITADSVVGSRKTWVYDHPFFLILNVAVGGNFVGAPNAQTTFPQSMTVDYVRVSRRSP
jgi:beta-glucanase (GH16 family)